MIDEVQNRNYWTSNIKIIQNVLSQNQLSLFCTYIREKKKTRGKRNDAYRYICKDAEIQSVFDEYLTPLVSAVIGMPLTQHKHPIFMNYIEGSAMPAHSDGYRYNDRFLQKAEGNSNLILCSSNIYLDADCTGGELYFENLDFTYVPKNNEMVVFPAHEMYRHRVNEVTSGYRDNCVTFYASNIMLEMHKTMVQYSPFKDL